MTMGHGGTDAAHGGMAMKAPRTGDGGKDGVSRRARTPRGFGRAATAALVVVSSVLVSAVLTSQPASASGTAVLQGWGDNTYGELGNGTKANSTVPTNVTLPPGVTGFTAVAAGGQHTLAIGSDGNLYAWGDNGYGELGNGTTTSSTTPVEVHMPTGIHAVKIAAGLIDSLATGSDGKVYAWGDNGYDELGDGNTTDSSLPVKVSLPAGVNLVTKIAAGQYHNLALTQSGSVYAWGLNSNGQLGDGTTTTPAIPVKVALPAGTTANNIAAGGYHSMASDTAGDLYAWGLNGNGQLGLAPLDKTSESSPTLVDMPTGVSATQLAAGLYHSLAVGSDGNLYAWGYDADGELGRGTTIEATIPRTTALAGGATPTAIAAGLYDSYALLPSGTLYAWGQNGLGQLGDGNKTATLSQEAVSFAPGSTVTLLATDSSSSDELALATPAAAVTTTSLSPSIASPVYGQTETLTATVTGSDGGGTVDFEEGASSLSGCSTVALTASGSNYQAQCTTTTLPAGPNNLTAAYSGDTASAGSTSANLGVTVTPAPLTVTASSQATVYGTAPVAVTASYAGFENGDSASSLTTQPSCSTSAGASSHVGNYSTSCSGASDPDYSINYANGEVAVGPAPLSIAASSPMMTYGSAVPAVTATYTGFQNSDSASSLTHAPVCTTTATSQDPVGTYPSSCSGASDPDYSIQYTPGSVVIGAAPLVIMASSVATTYGTAATAITPSYSGFLNGDKAASLTTQPTCGSATTVTTGVGVYPSTCSGASDPNYSITYVGGSVTISPAPITITASSASMIYGGGVPNVIPTVDGLQNNEGSSVLGSGLHCSTTATSVADVGSYPTTCSGASDPNYSITYVGGSVSVTPAPITVTASTDSMIYGGTVPTITPTVGGLQNNQDASVLGTGLTCSTHATPTSPIGAYRSSCSGGSDANYSIEYVDGTTSVTPAPLTITASSASMTYGGTVPTIVPEAAGLQNGETVSVLGTGLECTTSAVSSSPVIPSGYESTCSGAVDSNYDLNYVAGTVTVTPAPLSITASSGTMSYGSTPPTITPTYDGLANNDTAPATPPTCTTTATSTSGVGSYPSSCSGAADPNYDITYSNGSVAVDQATLIIVASSGTMSYGGTPPTITPTYEGLANNDSAPATPPTCTTTATSSSGVGSYPSSCSGAADPNYTIAYTSGTIKVQPAALTITASSSSEAYGVAPPAITPTYVGLVNGDTAPATPPTCTTTATSSSTVGTYPTSCSGAADPNYTINYNGGTVTVTPAPLSITASSGTMSYGVAPPTITPTYVGLVNGDTAPATPPTCATTATSSSPAGSYPTSCLGAADPDYQITYTAGQVVVGQATLIVVASSGTMSYGGTPPTITPTYVGLVNGDTAPATLPACATTATPSSTVGTYPATCWGAADPNYTITYSNGTVHVDPAALTITASSSSEHYGVAPPAITPTYVGLVNGDTAPATPPTCTTTATSSSTVGTYPTTCSGAADPDYAINYNAGTVKVTPAPLSITASSGTMSYGGTPPTITPTYVGLVNGDTAPATSPSCTTTATSSSGVGTYPSHCTGAADSDYQISYSDGSVTVGDASLIIVASSGSMDYGSTPPTITATYEGLANNDSAPATPPTCTTTATSSSGVGSYPSSCSGAADPNYTIAYANGTVTVDPAALTVTASSASVDYGAAPPAITASYSGFVNSESAAAFTTAPTCTTTVLPTTPVGTYASSCSGAVDANYAFTYVAGTVTVSPAPLGITASSGSMLYGGAVPQTTADVTGLQNEEASSVLSGLACSTEATPTSPVGSYPTSCSGAVDANYTITYTAGTLAVTPAPLTITASSESITYGGTPSAISPIVSGLQNGESTAELGPVLICSTAVVSTTAVGTYSSNCTGASDANYAVTYVPGTVQVVQAPLVVAATSGSMSYGGTPPTITPKYTGFVNGENQGVLNSVPVCTTAATSSSPVGTYPSSCSGGSDNNYAFSYVPGQVVVGPSVLVISASSGTSTYGGTPSTVTPSYAGFVNGDTAASLTTKPTCTSQAGATSQVGSYANTCSGAADPNYTIDYVAGSQHVTAASVTVQASSATMVYGSAPPAITPTVTGLVNGEGVAVLGGGLHCSTAATATSTVGSYASTCSGASDPNYNVTYASGTVTVTPAVLTVTASNQTMQFGSSVPALTATITGFVDGQTLSTSGVTGQPSCTTTATSTSAAGTYPIVCQAGTLKATNYTFQFAPGTLTVTATNTLACFTFGSVTVAAGQADRIAPGCVVIGSITVDAGGSLDSEGALVLGSLVSHGGTVRVCSTSFALYLSVTGATTPIVLGDGTSACGGSVLIGLVTLTSDTAGVSVQRADALGAIVVQKDSGGVTVVNNTVLGDLNVTQNTGTVVDRPNTVYGGEQLQ